MKSAAAVTFANSVGGGRCISRPGGWRRTHGTIDFAGRPPRTRLRATACRTHPRPGVRPGRADPRKDSDRRSRGVNPVAQAANDLG